MSLVATITKTESFLIRIDLGPEVEEHNTPDDQKINIRYALFRVAWELKFYCHIKCMRFVSHPYL